MDAPKFDFIKNQFVPLVKTLSADTAGNWGKMNGQQMVGMWPHFQRVGRKIIFPS